MVATIVAVAVTIALAVRVVVLVTAAPAGHRVVVEVRPGSGINPEALARITNDDFNGAALNTSKWSFVNPGGGSSVSVDGGHAVIHVPGGSSHNPSRGADRAPRLMQHVPKGDFSIDAKFDAAVTQRFQEQGIVAEQDPTHYVRASVSQNWYSTDLEASTISGTTVVSNVSVAIYGRPSVILRLGHMSGVWSLNYSYDGLHWSAAMTFGAALSIARVGVFAGNFGGKSSPAFVARVDYVVNSFSPPLRQDGEAWPKAPPAPLIDVWYGPQQIFGAHGRPQAWVNVLGDVSDPGGLASLSYTLNGGVSNDLAIGENDTRLASPGDFNAEIDFAALDPGRNVVDITARDVLGHVSSADVTVIKAQGGPWPLPYTSDWSKAGGNINSVAQIADGHWQIRGGTIHNLDWGYDRLVTLGDARTWAQYEVTAQITITSMDPDGSAVGIVAGWQGATSDFIGPPLADQPRRGHPYPAAFTYANGPGLAPRLQIDANTVRQPEATLIADTSGARLRLGVAYTFRFRVVDNASGGSHFSFKVWQTGTREPATWLLEADGARSRGSIALVAHRADVSIGTVAVTR